MGREFDAQIVVLEHKSIICAGYSAVLHIHAVVEEVQLVVSLSVNCQYPCSVYIYILLPVVSRATISYTYRVLNIIIMTYGISVVVTLHVHMSFMVAIWDPVFPLHVRIFKCTCSPACCKK